MECRAYTHRNLSSNVRQFQISSELSEQRKDLCLTFENRSRGTQRLGGLVIPVSVSEMLLTRSQLLITSDILLYFVRFNYISIFFSGCHIRNFFFFLPFYNCFPKCHICAADSECFNEDLHIHVYWVPFISCSLTLHYISNRVKLLYES